MAVVHPAVLVLDDGHEHAKPLDAAAKRRLGGLRERGEKLERGGHGASPAAPMGRAGVVGRSGPPSCRRFCHDFARLGIEQRNPLVGVPPPLGGSVPAPGGQVGPALFLSGRPSG